MHTVNHAAVGAGVAIAINEPLVALPLALASHFVLDALPHYGISGDEGFAELFRHMRTFAMITVDLIGSVMLVFVLIGQPWYVFAAMFMAVSPDFIWLYRYFLFERKGRKPPKAGLITRFHQRIQWCERSWGVFIEIPLATLLITILWRTV